MDIQTILGQLVINILLGDLPVAEVIKNVTGIAHFDEA